MSWFTRDPEGLPGEDIMPFRQEAPHPDCLASANEAPIKCDTMRILIAIPHYCGSLPQGGLVQYGSQRARLPRAAALNQMIVALHRYFGSDRSMGAVKEAREIPPVQVKVDIVIVTMKDRNVLDMIGIDQSHYDVEYFDGEPLMLSFETQRALRNRKGSYDVYGTMEDDLIICDPEFFNKIVWFQAVHGAHGALQPHRYEQSKTGSIGLALIDHTRPVTDAFRRAGRPEMVSYEWNGRQQDFLLPSNPHSGCSFVSDEQLHHWINQPHFYDRDTSWVR